MGKYKLNPFTNNLDRVTTSEEVDHGLLTGLVDDDHTQYALLNGRVGGQTLIGGTSASNNLILQSTSNATKGKINFGNSTYDEANNSLGIGTTSPQRPLHIANNGSQSQLLLEDNDATSGLKYGGIKFTDGALQLNSMDDTLTPTTRLYIAPTTGNVGIGTASPSEKLSINGSMEVLAGGIMKQTSNSWGDKWWMAGSGIKVAMDQTSTSWLSTFGGSTSLTKFRWSSTKAGGINGPILDLETGGNAIFYGNVGIGTTTPTAKTHIKGATSDNTAYGLKIDGSSGAKNFYVRNDGRIEFKNYAFPVVDGTSGQVLTTDGAGTLSWDSRDDYGEMYVYNKSIPLQINTADTYHAFHQVTAGDITSGLTNNFTINTGRVVDADITSEANNGGKLQIVTSANHLLTTGDIVVITNANDTGHNKKTRVTVDNATTFTCQDINYVAGAGTSAAVVDLPAHFKYTGTPTRNFIFNFCLSGNSASANKVFKIEAVKNITDLDNIVVENKYSTADIQNVSQRGAVQLSTNDIVWIQFINMTGDTTDFTVKHLNITIRTL